MIRWLPQCIIVAILLWFGGVGVAGDVPSKSQQRDVPSQKLLPPGTEPVSLCPEADKYLQERNPGEAIFALSNCIRKNPKEVALYLMRGSLRMGHGELDKAWEDFDRAVHLDPKYSKAFELRGMAEIERKNHQKGLKDLDQAIHLDPHNKQQLLTKKGNVLLTLGRTDEAIGAYSEIIKASPEFFGGYANRANAYVTIDNYSKALLDYDKAVLLEPDLPPLRLARGLVKFYMWNYESALEDFFAAYSKIKSDYAGLITSVALYRTGKNSAGEKILKEILPNSLPSNKPIIQKFLDEISDDEFIQMAGSNTLQKSFFFGFLGQYYMAKGKRGEAIKYFQQCITLNPSCQNIPCRFSRAELKRLGQLDRGRKTPD